MHSHLACWCTGSSDCGLACNSRLRTTISLADIQRSNFMLLQNSKGLFSARTPPLGSSVRGVFRGGGGGALRGGYISSIKLQRSTSSRPY